MRTQAGRALWRCSQPFACRGPVWKLSTNVRWSTSSARQWSTPLAKTIADAIEATGPISIAAYMRQCLTSPDGGYYTTHTEGKDQFGQKGDFITSPEISQIFGELLGIWLVAEWMAQGKVSSGVEIIEVGPGRGTLMDDMLRTLSKFKALASSIESIYLVEASPSLRNTQKQLLCGDAHLEEVDIGFRSTSKYSDLPITWCEDIRLVPNGRPFPPPHSSSASNIFPVDPSKTPFIFAHEFFDALPLHAFQSVAPNTSTHPATINTPTGSLPLSTPIPTSSKTPQWRELVVTPSLPPPTLSSPPKKPDQPPDFQLSIAKASNPSSLVLPNTSARYKALLATPGAVIEISPESHAYAADFARRIGGAPIPAPKTSPAPPTQAPQPTKTAKPTPSGAALILDYGPASTIPTSTLRGIRAHALVSPFSSPGLVDISVDVDFTALAEAAVNASPGVEVHGPVEQGAWLEGMGVRERAEMICKGLEGDDEGKARVRTGVERLVERGGGGMGRVYKVLAIVPERGGRRPVGFGGGVG